MKKSLFIIAILSMITTAALAGPCDHSWQTASDGSRCGARAADMRPGGR